MSARADDLSREDALVGRGAALGEAAFARAGDAGLLLTRPFRCSNTRRAPLPGVDGAGREPAPVRGLLWKTVSRTAAHRLAGRGALDSALR